MFGCKTCKVLEEQLRLERELSANLRERLEETQIRAEDHLKIQLGIEQGRARDLQGHILHPPVTEVVSSEPAEGMITPKHVPWNIERQRREAEDRAKHAKIVAEQEADAQQKETERKGEIEQLEKELQVG